MAGYDNGNGWLSSEHACSVGFESRHLSKNKIGDISKGVANTLQSTKTKKEKSLKIFRKPHHNLCFGFPSLSLVDFLQYTRYTSQRAFETIFSITGGFQNNFQSHRRLPESQNKLPEEGYQRGFQNKRLISKKQVET